MMYVFPRDIQKDFYYPSHIIIKGELEEVSVLAAKFSKEKTINEKADEIKSSIFKDHNAIGRMLPGFLLLEVKVKEILKKEYRFEVEERDSIKAGDTIFFVYAFAPEFQAPELKKGNSYWLFLISRPEYTSKTLQKYFQYSPNFLDGGNADFQDFSDEKIDKNLYFYSGMGRHSLMEYNEEQYFTEAIEIINILEHIPSEEEKASKWEEIKDSYKENPFLKNVKYE
ncbi:MAG: hypothetical protein JW928_03440 [Candidatus Aureabacteria bacterium]|nr:hypothetical protein [Candidatus Auribacterota bacterium]